MLLIIAAFIIAYLLGAIPTAVWFGKLVYGTDVRQHGSGNSGATNTFRVLGKGPGSFVLFFDILKGFLAAMLAVVLVRYEAISDAELVKFQLLLGLTSVLGHIYSVYLGFKGGKGVATLLGMMLAIHPWAALAALGVFVIVLLTTRYVSLGSMVGALSFPLWLLVPGFHLHPEGNPPVLIAFGFVLAGLVFYTHRQNIQRLRTGTESKVGKKKS